MKCTVKVEKDNSCSPRKANSFHEAWNGMQVCLEKPLRYCLYVSAPVIKIYFAQKLVFSLAQIKVSCIHIVWQNRFPMFVSEELHILRLNKCLRKRAIHDALFQLELSQWNMETKMKILFSLISVAVAVILFWTLNTTHYLRYLNIAYSIKFQNSPNLPHVATVIW